MIHIKSLSVVASLSLLSFAVLAEQAADNMKTESEVKDAEESQAIIEQVKEVTDKVGSDTSKTWIPSAVKFDWVQLTSNEWLKGEIKGSWTCWTSTGKM